MTAEGSRFHRYRFSETALLFGPLVPETVLGLSLLVKSSKAGTVSWLAQCLTHSWHSVMLI